MGKRKKKDTKKELLEQKRIKFQIYESFTAIIATIVTMLLAIITAVLSWIDWQLRTVPYRLSGAETKPPQLISLP